MLPMTHDVLCKTLCPVDHLHDLAGDLFVLGTARQHVRGADHLGVLAKDYRRPLLHQPVRHCPDGHVCRHA
jgi:hypothetical protein